MLNSMYVRHIEYKFCISCLIKTINQNLIDNLTRIDKFNDKNNVNNHFKTKISKHTRNKKNKKYLIRQKQYKLSMILICKKQFECSKQKKRNE